MSAVFVFPIAHHVVQAMPFFAPVIILPLILLCLLARDRLREHRKPDA